MADETKQTTSTAHVDITHDQMDGGLADDPSRKSTTIYAAPQLEKIRALYVAGSPIALPPQLESERAALDAQRAARANASGSTGSASNAKLTLAAGNMHSPTGTGSATQTSASAPTSGSTATGSQSSQSQLAGTAGSTGTPSAQ